MDYEIYAIGKRGLVRGKRFDVYKERNGTYPVFSEEKCRRNGGRLQEKCNKVPEISSLHDVVSLLERGGFRLRLKELDTQQMNIFKAEHLVIRQIP
jgi:hypothetical protein